jgi:hypothetical protein
MGRIYTDRKIENTSWIRCANAGCVVEKTLASALSDAFSKHLPAWLAQAKPYISPIIRANPGNRWFQKMIAKMEHRETRIQRRELLPLLTLNFTHPCPARTTQRTGGFVTPESRSA